MKQHAMKEHPSHSGFRPRLIFWELTTGCNLRCIHCRASASELMSPDDLTTSEAFGVVDQIAEYAPFILVLTGGEPLWRTDVFDIAAQARGRGIRVALATNGTLVDDAIADRIARIQIARVAISLDGADAATHDRFRGQPGAFDSAVAGFRRLASRGVSMQINTTVSQNNVDQLPQLYHLAESLGAVAFHIFLLVPVGCGLTIQDEQKVSAEKYEEVLNWFYDRTLESTMDLKATCAPHYFRVMRQRRAEGTAPGSARRSYALPARRTVAPGRQHGRRAHAGHDAWLSGRQRRLLHLSSGRSLPLRVPARFGGQCAATALP